MALSKEGLKRLFARNWKKHYKTNFLTEKGFVRKQCVYCKRFFWTLDNDREKCGDSTCNNLEFIEGKSKKISYLETWSKIKRFFEKNDHSCISRYPTVCRWRQDLYFTNASIIDFQPFVVSGEIEAPANPLIVPQPCIRFGDIENVGVTGQHYTSFIMFGQHAFNTKKTGLFYWKDRALEMDFNYLTKIIGVKKELLAFQEEVWVGGGNFGPSLEYCAQGLELGNCVFMQFKDCENNEFKELDTRVIDMGAGLERLAWYANKTSTSYDVTFEKPLKWVLKKTGIKKDTKFMRDFARISGILDVDTGNIKQNREKAAKSLGLSVKEMLQKISGMQAVYAVLDHIKTLMYAVSDGMMPSNGGGGYNLRIVSRRAFSLAEKHGFELDFAKIAELHAVFLKRFDSQLFDSLNAVSEVLSIEKRKFFETRKKSQRIIKRLLQNKTVLDQKMFLQLYESHGITPEFLKREAKKEQTRIRVPENFYGLIAKPNKLKEKKEKWHVNVSGLPETQALYYEDAYTSKFYAKVLAVKGNAVVLDKTAFYPEGGGQIGDKGRIGKAKVIDTQKKQKIVLHFVDKPELLKTGSTVFCEVDWVKRFSIMKHHSVTHLLNAACRKILGSHVWQSGSLKTEKKAHLDITHYKKISLQELNEIEFLVNKWINENHEILISFFPRNKAEEKFGFRIYQGGYVPAKTLRIVNIKGIDVEACAGTHVKKTGEIGFFKIRSRNSVQDGIERIEYSVSMKALKFLQKKMMLLHNASKELGVPEHSLVLSVKKLFKELKNERKKIEALNKNFAKTFLESEVIERNGIALKEFFGVGFKELIAFADSFVKQKPYLTACFFCNEKCVVIKGKNSEKKAVKVLNDLIKRFGGKGGGNQQIAQGVFENQKLRNLLK